MPELKFAKTSFRDFTPQELIDRERESRRMQEIEGIGKGLSGLAAQNQQAEQTKRQRALQSLQLTADLRKSGYDVSPEQVQSILEPQPEPEQPSLLSRAAKGISGLFQDEPDPEAPGQVQPRPEPPPTIFGQMTPEFISKKQRQEQRDKLMELQLQEAERKSLEVEKPFEETREGKNFLAKKQAELETEERKVKEGRRQMSANDVKNLNEGREIPNTLQDVEAVIGANTDLFDPITGRIASQNPYNEKVQTINAQLKAASQQFGRFMEGGVLRKEDEAKYRKMMPQIGDTPEVAANKLDIVKRMLIKKYNSDVEALGGAGFNVKQFSPLEVPGLPQSIAPQQAQPVAPAPVQHPQANEALDWARQNPNDPRALEIMKRLGTQ